MKVSERILIIKNGAIGDFLLSLPTFHSIRMKFPEAYIEIMGNSEIIKLVEDRFYADKGISIEISGFSNFFIKDGNLPDSLVNYFKSFQKIFTYLNDKDGTFANNLSKAGVKEVYPFEILSPELFQEHAVKEFSKILNPSDIGLVTEEPKIFLNESDRQFASNFFRSHFGLFAGKSYIAIHPGSGSTKKNWPLKNFIELSEQLLKNSICNILLLSGPAEEKSVNFSEIAKIDGIIEVKDLSLHELAAILERCDLYIGNDSGITHLSAAVGIPTIAIFGPTNAKIWGPIGNMVKIISLNLSCSPCARDKMFGCEQMKCLELVTVNDLLKACKFFFASGKNKDKVEKSV
ncbi:MAG: hypothetical protein A2042_04075 [Candidatus Schekmanbacteria bacterium GWA2_38_11]|uniref:Lipopolysaccharide heptosyltransferase II n=1 Tax=Candidatus Schekmanbacteria bacterium GWA2_38_11 TaxID=1817876 RepID=A0A1F7RCH1_9BACT|nr:MAG: hypothetical protein A2042_04075 [Candidatus Schekmanbacteria bacterium GWA2_38_11]